MKITFVLPCLDLSGGVRVVATYAELLRQRGHEVFVVALPPAPIPLRRRVKSWVLGRGWPAQPRRGASHFDRAGVPHRVLARHRPLRASDVPDADVIVATWWETAAWIADFPPSKGAKVHFVQGDEANPLWMSPDRIAAAQAAHRLPLSKVTISRSLESMLRSRYGATDLTLIPNGVDGELFDAPPRAPQGRPTVGLLYSTMKLKGCDISLAAIAQVQARIPELHVVSFGVHQHDASLPLPPGATYEHTPPQERIRELYAQCDAWICGSRSEGFHLPPLEAMACRVPVVSTRVGGPEDVVVDGQNGFLVDLEDTSALAERLHHVLTLPDAEWKALSDGAYATARRATWDAAADRFEATLRRVAQREQPGDGGT
ncbi:MAG: glycosyltransferase family 4 protein, partial [Myxococcota bacterium]|nr:glycosyltransferase family 4 protein [Myxococcota bacterium]